MAWDNIISRFSWLFLQPSNLMIIILIVTSIGIMFSDKEHKKYKLFIRTNLTLIIIISAISFTNLASWIMLPLESRFSDYRQLSLNENYSGIIVLAGSERTIVSSYVNQVTFSNAGERLYQTFSAANLFPSLPIIHSGGGRNDPSQLSENEVAEQFFIDSGLDLNRVRFDDKSYNTYTNAIESKKLFKSNENQKWLLITSAYHMPRAVGAFQKAEINIHPYPVDYRTPLKYYSFIRFNMSENFRIFDLAIHEYLGLISYYFTGRSSSVFPNID